MESVGRVQLESGGRVKQAAPWGAVSRKDVEQATAKLPAGTLERMVIAELRKSGPGSLGDLSLRMGLRSSSTILVPVVETLQRRNDLRREGAMFALATSAARADR